MLCLIISCWAGSYGTSPQVFLPSFGLNEATHHDVSGVLLRRLLEEALSAVYFAKNNIYYTPTFSLKHLTQGLRAVSPTIKNGSGPCPVKAERLFSVFE